MTIEELLRELCYWEDPDAALILHSTEGGGVCLMDNDGDGYVEAPTLIEALQKKYDAWKGLD